MRTAQYADASGIYMTSTEPTPPLQTSTIIMDGRTYLVFPFTHADSLKMLPSVHQHMREMRLLDFNRLLKIPLTSKQKIKIKKNDYKVWEEKPFVLDKQYFHEFVQQIFGNTEINREYKLSKIQQLTDFIKDYIGLAGRNKAANSHASTSGSLAPLELSPEACNLISGRFGTRSKGLCVKLTKAAVKRLKKIGYEPQHAVIDDNTVSYLRFDIEQVNCLFFGTGVGMLVMHIEFMNRAKHKADLPVDYILELNNLLCRSSSTNHSVRNAACFWYQDLAASERDQNNDVASNQSASMNHLTDLGHLVRMLIGSCNDKQSHVPTIRTIHWEKVPIFSAIKTTAFTDRAALELTSIRLARKETSDYLPCAETVINAFYRPFDYLTHTASLEGGAMLVEIKDADSTPYFVDNFVSNSSKRAYLPLMLWALHEYLFLTELSKTTGNWVNFHKPQLEDTLRLQDFRERIYNYRFHFRFAQASVITMHNDMYRLWRTTFDLGRILDEIDKDVAEAESKLEHIYTQRAQRAQERGRTMIASLVALGGVVISVPDWQDKTVNNLLPSYCQKDPAFFCNDLPLHFGLIGLGILSLSLFLLYAGYKLAAGTRRLLRSRKIKAAIARSDYSSATDASQSKQR